MRVHPYKRLGSIRLEDFSKTLDKYHEYADHVYPMTFCPFSRSRSLQHAIVYLIWNRYGTIVFYWNINDYIAIKCIHLY